MVREVWQIDGFLQADTQALLTADIDALEAAYTIQGQDLILYLADGVTETSHKLLSGDALGGVRVVRPPSYPHGVGAQYSRFRSFSITLEADIPDLTIGLLSWDEVLTFSGGGPRFVMIQTLTGPPQKQFVAEQTPYVVTQEGRAVGQFARPLPASPIWPAALHGDQGAIVRRAPRRVGPAGQRAYIEFEVSWSYVMESSSPLFGNPTPAPS